MSSRGFSLNEVLIALAMGGVIMLMAVAGLRPLLERSRVQAAARQVVNDVGRARSRAITTGWEYRVVGFDLAGSPPNRYRTFGRRATSVAWPADTAAPMQSADQFAGAWIDFRTRYPGVNLDSSAARFEVTFDSRGTATATTFNTLRLTGRSNQQFNITVSNVGAVRVQ